VQAEKSFVDILREVLKDDDEAKINPLSQEVRFVIKSFILFAENGFQPQTLEPPPTPSKYFKGVVAGLEGVKALIAEKKDTEKIYIGFVGGRADLQKADLNQLADRPFKWDNNLTGKTPSNWIPLEEFKEILIQKGWAFDAVAEKP
jgi:hypothetical protein